MLEKLNPKDVRALKLGAAGIAAIIVLLFILELNERWTKASASFDAMNTKLSTLAALDITETKYAALRSIVPVFKMPVEKEIQKYLFMDSLNEQFKKAGINNQPWEELGGKSKMQTGYEVLRLNTSGKCNINQLFDLLTNLKENPYLIGIEELTINCDTKNQQQADFEITVSTPVKSKTKSSKGLL